VSPPPAKRPYHHGNLRAELVRAALEVLGETGVARFSVAQAAKRAGVSSAAPYRHFADREALLAACATVVAGELADALTAAADAVGADPVERLAVAAGAYTRYVIEHRVGLDLVYAEGLQNRRYVELHVEGRRFMDVLLSLALDAPASAGYDDVFGVLEGQLATAHGFATLQIDGGFARSRLDTEEVVARATRATRAWAVGRAALREQGAG
jgi:AcrR family transcriptional regulator